MKKLIPFRMSGKGWGKKGRDLDIAEAEYTLEGKELNDKILDINNNWDKKEADEKKEPWVNVIKMGVDPDNVVQGFFELDWNDHFVQYLMEQGIEGANDEDVVNKWFNAVCRTVLLQEKADLDYGMQQGRSKDDVLVATRNNDDDTGTKSKK
tara:strand:- start:6462 stop:6917 length:456 start_codon:yes stop_codon:yes gene_type:complete